MGHVSIFYKYGFLSRFYNVHFYLIHKQISFGIALFKFLMIYGHCTLAVHVHFFFFAVSRMWSLWWVGLCPWCLLFGVFWLQSYLFRGRGQFSFVCFYYFLQISGWLLPPCIILKFIAYLIALLFFMIMSVLPIRGS